MCLHACVNAELMCRQYWASKANIVGQVLGPSVCVCGGGGGGV